MGQIALAVVPERLRAVERFLGPLLVVSACIRWLVTVEPLSRVR